MKTIACLAAVSLMTLSASPLSNLSADNHRFLIQEGGKFGFIDSSGNVVIAAQLENALDFSEDLAAVRIDGRYGFVNLNGDVVVDPIYDYATEYKEGLALVYVEGKPFFIDKTGTVAFPVSYHKMSSFENGRARIVTASGKMGIIDTKGKLLIETVYSRIQTPFQNQTVVYKWKADKDADHEIGVIDNSGNTIVPFGRYRSIEGPFDGYYVVELETDNDKDETESIIDSGGKVIYTLDYKKYVWLEDEIHNDIVVATVRDSKRKMDRGEYHDAYLSISGAVIFDRDVVAANNFSENFAFFRGESGRYSLIDRKGNLIARNAYDKVLEPGFGNGRAIVEVDSKWGVIDTTGAYILSPQLKSVEHVIGDYIITMEDTKDDRPKFGIWDLKGNAIIQPVLQYLDRDGFINGLLRAQTDDRLTYFDVSGKIVWQESKPEDDERQPLNIDFLNRGHFYVEGGATGHPVSMRRAPNENVTMLNSFEGAALTIVANTYPEVTYGKNITGMVVYVANTTGDTIRFNAQDGRLYMKMQAVDPHGQWRDIEYLPNSWCGNSYHSLSLSPNQFWTFVAPVYEGNFHTKLRVELKYVSPNSIAGKKLPAYRRIREGEELMVYSNTFEGSINLAQFWRMPGYTPGGIMDPYNE